MAKERRRPRWKIYFSASGDNVRFSLQGSLGRRAGLALVIAAVLIVCALLAPEVAVELSRLTKLIIP